LPTHCPIVRDRATPTCPSTRERRGSFPVGTQLRREPVLPFGRTVGPDETVIPSPGHVVDDPSHQVLADSTLPQRTTGVLESAHRAIKPGCPASPRSGISRIHPSRSYSECPLLLSLPTESAKSSEPGLYVRVSGHCRRGVERGDVTPGLFEHQGCDQPATDAQIKLALIGHSNPAPAITASSAMGADPLIYPCYPQQSTGDSVHDRRVNRKAWLNEES
jgi:hypothetical protein